jgi:leucyl aminopeptidase (aminopeptidase T)
MLSCERIAKMRNEETVAKCFRPFFHKTSEMLVQIHDITKEVQSGAWKEHSLEEMREINRKLYEDILPENYENSYANPDYAVRMLGEEYAPYFSFLYTELRGAICYGFEERIDYLTILQELFIEFYNCFEADELPPKKEIRDMLYWYVSDYCDVFQSDRIVEQIDPDVCFASEVLEETDPSDLRYLYSYGEYVTPDIERTARYLADLPEETIAKMADVYTEGYRRGFIAGGKDLSKKKTVNIRYTLGFERVVQKAIKNFAAMGLRPTIYRAAVSVITKRQQIRIGYYGGVANPQYDYDHKDDMGLFLDKRLVERRLDVLKNTYEQHKTMAGEFAGPACMEVFGEIPFSPEHKEHAVKLSKKQEEYEVQYQSKAGQITNKYIKGEERSFTIIAWPTPEIGDQFEEIFDEVIRINTLDADIYEKVQQTIIDTLDTGVKVEIFGKGDNETNLTVMLHPLTDPDKETIFENCVADVNIPVGEVFTSPVLEGTEGTLHVSSVYLNDLQYRDLKVEFKDGKIADYSCGNFEDPEAGRRLFRENVMKNRETLPLGEFAIGTNTTAYVVAEKYHIQNRLPILIAEKMGPHFAVGDTCYSWSEDIPVYNPDGKEIIARDNSISILRKESPEQAYFNCHTDITIPYEELREIAVVNADGARTVILSDGRFVLPGTEELNRAFE